MHARIQVFFQEGGPRPNGQKTVWTTFFFLVLLVLNLFYSLQRGSSGSITEKAKLFHGSRGGPTFSWGGGGVQLFPGGGGVQVQISIETRITCDFPGMGGPDPLSLPSGSAHDMIPLSLAYFNQSGLEYLLKYEKSLITRLSTRTYFVVEK